MSVTRSLSNKFYHELGKGSIKFDVDDFIIILMGGTFVFDPDNHGIYDDIDTDEIATANGYTQGAYELTVDTAWAQDNAGNKASIAWGNAAWTASGGDIGPVKAAVVLQKDAGTLLSSVIVGCIDFGEEITISDGVSFQLQNLGFDLAQGGA